MSEEIKGDGVTPDQVSSASDQEVSPNASGVQDTVKYDTYKRVLSEKKKTDAKFTQMAEELEAMKQDKLQAEGKIQDLLASVTAERDGLKKKLADAHGAFATKSAMDVIVDEANKLGVASTGLLRKAVQDKIQDLEFDDEYRPNGEQVKMILSDLQREEPFLFSKDAPKIANHNPQPGGTGSGQGKALKDMSDEELNNVWAGLSKR